jgi:exopolyphosphatase/guanosine-5'-triphosphate,3'-diphosphate pyrophosphatase
MQDQVLKPDDPGKLQESQLQQDDLIAAIDIGSNSLRLVVAQIIPGPDYRVLDEERIPIRLARSLTQYGRLDDAAINDALTALRRFNKIASGFNVKKIRTIATSAVREADNGIEFCERAKHDVGLEVEVISAKQEGQLAYRSVAKAFDIEDKNIAVADIGGGSTEVVLVSSGHIEDILPTKLGAVRMTEMFAPSSQLFEKSEDYSLMIREIDRRLKKHLKKKSLVPQVLIGTGGTFTTLASMLMAQKGIAGESEWGYRIPRADVSHLLDMLRKMTLKQRRNVQGLSDDRADIIVAGLAIIDRLMARLKVNILQVHDRGVRDGLLISMINEGCGEVVAEEDHQQALEFFAGSCGVDINHTRHVADLALKLFHQLQEKFELPEEDARLLHASAMLQDVGYLINYEKHHKHSYNLVLNSHLPGLSRHELEIIANVARYHRGATPKKKHSNFERLAPEDRTRVKRLASILRIAGSLDRSHKQQVTNVVVKLKKGHANLAVTFTGDPEVDLWAARSRTEFFEKVFDTELTVVLSD